MRKIFKEAHKMTREIASKYEVDYQAQFGLCLAYLLEEKEEKKVELIGSEKQVAWAKKIKDELLAQVEDYKKHFNKDTTQKRNFFIIWKEEIKGKIGGKSKVNRMEAMEIVNNLLDTAIKNIKEETSAKRLIEVKKSLGLWDSNLEDYVIREFL